jgi:hypothetical protein
VALLDQRLDQLGADEPGSADDDDLDDATFLKLTAAA